MVKIEEGHAQQAKAQIATNERLLDLLLGPKPKKQPVRSIGPGQETQIAEPEEAGTKTREKFKQMLLDGHLDDREVEIDAPQRQFPVIEIFSPQGMEELGVNFQEMFSGLMPQKTKRRKMSIREARKFILNEELGKLVNMDDVVSIALERVQHAGIIFVDEIDKIAGGDGKHGPDVSREGVQRDILPIVEGSAVMTKYGMVHTDHILFIAAGAFHGTDPSDLIPELQGRFPIRVELDSLTSDDFQRILTEPKCALIKQYQALLNAEGINLQFAKGAIKKLAEIAEQVNSRAQNIGARRLHTVLTTLLEDLLFSPPEDQKTIKISAKDVEDKLAEIVKDEDLSRYIL